MTLEMGSQALPELRIIVENEDRLSWHLNLRVIRPAN
jgi:hypothetical protein